MEKVVRKYKLGEEPDILDDYLKLSRTERVIVLKSIRERYQLINNKMELHGEGLQRMFRVIKK